MRVPPLPSSRQESLRDRCRSSRARSILCPCGYGEVLRIRHVTRCDRHARSCHCVQIRAVNPRVVDRQLGRTPCLSGVCELPVRSRAQVPLRLLRATLGTESNSVRRHRGAHARATQLGPHADCESSSYCGRDSVFSMCGGDDPPPASVEIGTLDFRFARWLAIASSMAMTSRGTSTRTTSIHPFECAVVTVSSDLPTRWSWYDSRRHAYRAAPLRQNLTIAVALCHRKIWLTVCRRSASLATLSNRSTIRPFRSTAKTQGSFPSRVRDGSIHSCAAGFNLLAS